MKFRIFSLNSSKDETPVNPSIIDPDSYTDRLDTIKSSCEDFPKTMRTTTYDEFAIRRET